uniref:glycosyltransferase n=1 Tax=Nocardioides sp. SYSU DS0663 TaxID=3416445 RepID=UPI003F4C52EE
MRIAYLVVDAAATEDDATRTVVAQANALAGDHDVRLLSLQPVEDPGVAGIDPAVTVRSLAEEGPDETLSARPSALLPQGDDRRLDASSDVALEAALPTLEVDAVVTADPGLLVAAVELLPDHVVVAHQDHRPTTARSTELTLRHLPRADVLVVADEDRRAWYREQLGPLAPRLEVLLPSLPGGYAPRSTVESPVVMAAGRLLPERQLPMLVAAFAPVAAALPEWRLRIWGTGPDRNDVVRQVRKEGLWDRVELPGAVTDPRTEWARAAVAAVPSRIEGYPLSIAEAMAAGVPVVAFDSGPGPRRMIDHDGSGVLVAPQSVAGLSTALLRLAGDVELRRRLGNGAHRSARAYDADALAERWVTVLADARARRGGRGRLAARA